MGKSKSLLKNTLALSAPSFINPAMSYVLILFISRRLGALGLGQYSLVLSYVGLFETFAAMGLSSLIIREVARKPEQVHDFFVNSCLFGLGASVISAAAMNGVVFLMDYEPEVFMGAVVMSATMVFYTFLLYIEAVFRAFEKSEYFALTYMCENTLRVAASVLLLIAGFSIVSLFAAYLATQILSLGVFLIFYLKVIGKPKFRIRPEILKLLFRQAPVFASIAIFSTIHLSIDTILLSKLMNVNAVGIYSSADRLLGVCKTLPIAFTAALLPVLSKEFSSGLAGLKDLTERSLKYLFLTTFPIVAGTFILADRIILLLYGQDFVPAGEVLRYHIISLIPFGMVYLMAAVLIATDHQKADLLFNAVTAVINIGLNFLLIPKFGVLGAVLATLCAVMIFNQLQHRFIMRRLFTTPVIRIMIKPFLAAAGMAGATWLMRDFNLFLNIGLSALIYLGLIFLIRALNQDELIFIKSVLKKE